MRHIRLITLCLLTIFGTQSCFKEGYLYEKDFSYTLSVPEHTLLGKELTATVTLSEDAPEWGYDYEFLVDGKPVSIPNLILKDDGTLDVGRSRVLKLNLTGAVTTMGRHKLVTKLHYNTWKTQSADFILDELITELYGLQAAYSQPCDETVTIKPEYDPKDNTDTLRWQVSDLTGDNVRVQSRGDGRFDVKTEHGLPGSCSLLFTTKNLEKRVHFDFYEIGIEDVTGIEAEYHVRKGGTIVLKPSVGPDKVMTRLDVKTATISGDEIACVTDYSDLTAPVFSLSTVNGNRTEGEFIYSYVKDDVTVSRTVKLHFYEPIVSFAGMLESYSGERTDWVDIVPVFTPADANEPFTCEITSSEYDTAEVIRTSDGTFRFRSVNQKPSRCTARFRTAGGTEFTTKVCFHHTIPMYVDVSVTRNFRITLRYDNLPGDWQVRPAFTFGLECVKSFFKVMQYPEGTGVTPNTKNVDIAGFADKSIVFTAGENGNVYTDDAIASKWFAAAQECTWTFVASAVNAALFVDETTDLYEVRPVPGTVKRTYVYYNRPFDCEPVPDESVYNRYGCVAGSREASLKEHSAEYWATSEERYSDTIRF